MCSAFGTCIAVAAIFTCGFGDGAIRAAQSFACIACIRVFGSFAAFPYDGIVCISRCFTGFGGNTSNGFIDLFLQALKIERMPDLEYLCTIFVGDIVAFNLGVFGFDGFNVWIIGACIFFVEDAIAVAVSACACNALVIVA